LRWALAALAAQPPKEFPTAWEIPPGDPLEHMTAGYAKILCSALFITGRDLATAVDEDGFFVSPRPERGAVTKTIVDSKDRAVHLTLPNGVTRTAKLYGDQGCVTLPRGADSAFFTPAKLFGFPFCRVLDRFVSISAERADHVGIQNPHAARGERAHCQFLPSRHPQFSHHENIQRRMQLARDLITDRHTAARQREHDQVARIAQVHQPPGEKSPGICPIEELHV
jgi:hypothetical protein